MVLTNESLVCKPPNVASFTYKSQREMKKISTYDSANPLESSRKEYYEDLESWSKNRGFL